MKPFALAAGIVLAAAAASPADPPVSSAAQSVAGVGVIAPDGSRIFVAGKAGLEAIDLATGKTVWTAEGPARPLLVAGDLLVTWTPDGAKFALGSYDAGTGKKWFAGKSRETAEWAAVDGGGGKSFDITAAKTADGVRVAWVARSMYFGGAAPTPEIEEAARKRAAGILTLDPKTGKIEVVKGDPKDEEFFGGSEKTVAAALGWEFGVEEQLPAGGFGKTKRTLSAKKGGKDVWSRELAGKDFAPPPP